MDRSTSANVGSWLRDRAALHPERAAVGTDGEPPLCYAELNGLANRCAAALRDAGVVAGDRVALALESEPLYLALFFAAAKLGAVLLPLNTRLTAHELAFQLEDAEPGVCIAARETPVPERAGTRLTTREAWLGALPPAADEPELAPGGEAPQLLMYTSGTTGTPKGALLPHRKAACNTHNAERYFGLTADDVVVVPVPLFHSYGLLILSLPALFAGARIVLLPRFDAAGLTACIARERATIVGAVPIMYQRMVQAGLSAPALASLRFAFSAGAPIDVGTIHAFHAAGVALKQGYGQTETSLLCCLDDEDVLRRAGSVGRTVGHCELRVIDERGGTLGPGTAGEIVVRGGVVMLGYWRRPEETRASKVDGWHRTGDLGVLDEEGYVTLVGRRKEMYISGGENVYPAEVERVLRQHPNVADAAVVGVLDREWGETGRAYVVPRSRPFDKGELLAWAGKRLAGYKRPRQVELSDELPRTPSGKIQKHLLVGGGAAAGVRERGPSSA